MNFLTTSPKANNRCSSAIQQLAETAGVGFNGSHPWDIQVPKFCKLRRALKACL